MLTPAPPELGPRWFGRTILIAEDELLIGLDLAQRVADAGPSVLGPVASVAAGMLLLETGLPDAAILDVNLSDGLVTRLAQTLIGAGVPTVLCTANEPESLPAELATLVNIGKPTTDMHLQSALQRLLGSGDARH